jgi:FixJ family two-component response regulator
MAYNSKATSQPRAAEFLSFSSRHTTTKTASERCEQVQPLSWASLLVTSAYSKPFVQSCFTTMRAVREVEEQIMSLAHVLGHKLGSPPMSDVTPTVFVVDDDISVHESLELLIRSEGWQPETFASAEEFLERPRTGMPSCLLLDLSLPGLTGLGLQKRVAVERADMPIIFITGYADVPTTVKAMKAGAVEFLTKPFKDDVLLAAIRAALERSRVALGLEAEVRTLWDRYASLSQRERQVMMLVVSGLLNKQVGGELGISEITVKAHRGKVMQKMKANSLADLVRMAARLHPAPAAMMAA